MATPTDIPTPTTTHDPFPTVNLTAIQLPPQFSQISPPQFTFQLVTPPQPPPPVLTFTTGNYYLGSVPFIPTAPPQQEFHHEEEEQISNNNNDISTQNDQEQGDDPDYSPDYSPPGEDDDDMNREDNSPASPKQSTRYATHNRKKYPKWSAEKKAVMLAKRKCAKVESLGTIETNEDGRHYYEGFEILKDGDSYSCASCSWNDSLLQVREGQSCPNWRKMRAIKLHIRGVHMRK